MSKHAIQALLVACLATGTLLAANDPFVGTWKLNQDKSSVKGLQLSIKDLGGNRYMVSFGNDPNASNTITADGSDQPVHFPPGYTWSVAPKGRNVWNIVAKKDGRIVETNTWTISPDGKTLVDEETDSHPDGTTSKVRLVSRRVAGTSGFAGTWRIANAQIGAPALLEIKPYHSDGLSFIFPAEHEQQSMEFDGKDYPDEGPNVPAGVTSSGHRAGEHTLETTGKIKGTVMEKDRYEISSDSKTLTQTIHQTGQPTPITIVWDRQ